VVTPHELRHSATELWVEEGATEEDIVRLLNHSSAASVRRYLHRSPERLKKIASVIDISLPTPQPPPKKMPILRVVR
jgi:integrase